MIFFHIRYISSFCFNLKAALHVIIMSSLHHHDATPYRQPCHDDVTSVRLCPEKYLKLARLLHKCTPSSGFLFERTCSARIRVSTSAVRTALVPFLNGKIKSTAHETVDSDDNLSLNESCFSRIVSL